MNIIDPSVFTKESLTIPAGTNQEQWQEIHRTVLLCRKAASKWLSQSRQWAVDQWGIDYVADAEVQMELALGLPQPEDKPTLNPDDKSKAMVTLEGSTQQFAMWYRKMEPTIGTWDNTQIKRALEYVEPIEQFAKALRARL